MSNKKNDLRPGRKIIFADGVERTIYPVTLRNLRKLMDVIKDLDTEGNELNDDAITKMVGAAQIVLAQVDPDLADDPECIEDTVDIKSFNQMLEAAMGTDPNE
jgi:hypothetical protein